MGIWDAFSDIVEAVTPWSVVEAEAPAEDKVRDFCCLQQIPSQRWEELARARDLGSPRLMTQLILDHILINAIGGAA